MVSGRPAKETSMVELLPEEVPELVAFFALSELGVLVVPFETVAVFGASAVVEVLEEERCLNIVMTKRPSKTTKTSVTMIKRFKTR